tara:strand:+ start:2045 stop:2671 length:627 start_codon:yes stop_codon:yes gene_type:complete
MKIIVKNARLSFNDLFTSKSINGGAPKFTATLICSGETKLKLANKEGVQVVVPHSKLQEVCEKVLKEKFGKLPAKADNWAYNKADGTTTRDEYINDDGDYWAGFDAETFYISAGKAEAKCKNGKMTILDQRREAIEENSGLLFSGCYVNAVLDVYAYDGDSGKGVTASLEGVQLLRKGEPLGFAKINAESEFDEEEIDADDDDAASMM